MLAKEGTRQTKALQAYDHFDDNNEAILLQTATPAHLTPFSVKLVCAQPMSVGQLLPWKMCVLPSAPGNLCPFCFDW